MFPSGTDRENLRLKKHFKPKRLAVAEQFRFNMVQQQQGQTIAEFVAQLKKLSAYCEYTGDQLKDRFICGLRSESIQKKLLAKTYSFERAVEIAIAEEATAKDIREMSQHGSPQIHRLHHCDEERIKEDQGQAQPRQYCDRCGLKNHTRDKCWHKDKKCLKCGNPGHLKSQCRSKKETGRGNPNRTNYVQEEESSNVTDLDTAVLELRRQHLSQWETNPLMYQW